MSLSKFKIKKGTNLDPQATGSNSVVGDLEVLQSDSKLHYHNGSTDSPAVTEAHSATLTNKTIDADSNTITNIENADIKAGAAIDAAKIHDGSVSNTEFGYLDGASGNLQVQINSNSSTISAHTGASSGVHGVTGSVVGTSDSQILTNKTIDADLNTISNIENADIKVGAAIDATKIADGSVSSTEFQYLANVSGDLQTQLNTDASNLAAHTGASSGVHGVVGSVVGTTDSQVLSNKTLTGAVVSDNIKLEDPGAGTNKITLQAPTLAGDYTLTLPVDDGDSGQLLSTNGTGTLSWTSALTDPTNASGDLIARASGGNLVAFPKGVNGQVLTVESSTSTGLSYRFSKTNVVSSADYVVLDDDGYNNIIVSTGSSNRTVTLPTLADNQTRRITISKSDSGTGFIIIEGEGSETVNGGDNAWCLSQYDSITVEATSGNWLVVNSSVKDISFRVGAAGTQNITSTAITKITAWDTVAFNYGGGWDSTNDRFNAPIDGRYYFDCVLTATSLTSTEVLRAWIYVDGSPIVEFRNTQTGTVNFIRVCAAVDLTENQQVDFRIESSADTAYTIGGNSGQTTVSGFKIG